MSTFARKANEGLDLSGKVAAVAGGTQGIGEATALRFAAAGASVYIIGRNSTLGDAVIEALKKAAKDPSKQTFEFLKADLSLVSGVKDVASTLSAKAGAHGIDYFITSAGATPNGVHSINSEGHDSFFAIGSLGRFSLAYRLAKAGTIKESILFILAPAGKAGSPPDVDDLELIKAAENNKYGIIACANQGSGILDSITYQFGKEFPSIRTMHAFPGFVATNGLSNANLPFIITLIGKLLMPILSRTIGNSPTGYAEIPVYLMANEASRKPELLFSNEKLQDQRPDWLDQKPEVAKSVWDKMAEMLDA